MKSEKRKSDPSDVGRERGVAASGRNAAVGAAALAVFAVSAAAVFRGAGGAGADPPPAGLAAGLVLIWLRSAGVLAMVAAAAWGYGALWRARSGGAALRMTVGLATWLGVNYLVAWIGGAAGGGGFSGGAVAANLLAGWGCWGATAWRQRADAKGDAHGLKAVAPGSGTTKNAGVGRYWPWTVVLGMPGLAVLLVAACCPPGTMWRVEAAGYDVTSYHLQIPREWIAAGGMTELPHSVYAYLPGLIEAGYAALAVLHGLLFAGPAAAGVVEPAVYVCQLFHVALAVLAAWNLAALVMRLTGGSREAGGFAAALVLLTPWVQVTGSLAYNEMAVLACAAAGLGVVLGPRRAASGVCDAVAVGLLAGAATLAKPTAGFAVALPLGALMVWRGWRSETGETPVLRVKAAILGGGLTALIGAATLSPWLMRNAVWTGNPVFPLATSVLGTGHWDAERAERWDRAHGRLARVPDTSAAGAVWRQALGNAGYGAVGGAATPRERHNVARFGREGGVPLLWLLAASGAVLAWASARRRRPAGAPSHDSNAAVRGAARRAAVVGWTSFLGWQFVGWLGLTHLQSRFLLPVVLPLAGLAGLGVAAALTAGRPGAWAARGLAGAAGLALALHAVAIAWNQAPHYRDDRGRQVAIAPGWLVDSQTEPRPDGGGATDRVNLLPDGSRVMVVGNNASLLYVRAPMVYASAFDRAPLTPFMHDAPAPAVLASRLRDAGFTHLWVGYSELDRLHATYGFDAAVTGHAVRRSTADWPVLGSPRAATVLYGVPASGQK